MSARDALGKRLGRFAALVGTVFALTAAVVVTERLSGDALALLVGLACGVGAMLPTLALGVVLWQRQERQAQRRALQTPSQPPVIVVAPPALPGYGYGADRSAAPWQVENPWPPARRERQFAIVGEEE